MMTVIARVSFKSGKNDKEPWHDFRWVHTHLHSEVENIQGLLENYVYDNDNNGKDTMFTLTLCGREINRSWRTRKLRKQ